MRVIAGMHGGRQLLAPPGRATRPTSDRVREALFSILGGLEGLRVLDLFAGSGALAIEALSRGAASATLVETAEPARRAIARNLESLAIDAEVVAQPAQRFLERAEAERRQYDLVFLDPPYRQARSLAAQLTEALVPVLAPKARVVAESDRRDPLELGLSRIDARRYGDTLIHLYQAAVP